MAHASHNARRSEQGFALIVVSAIFIALAVMAAAFMDRTNATQQINQQEQTRAQVSRISTAILQYYLFNNNTYPCPADPMLVSTDTNYGSGSFYTCSTATVSSGVLAGTSGVVVLSNSSPVTTEVIRGMVPVKDLLPYGLDPNDAIDLWNNKIMYVVNRNLTAKNLSATVFPTVQENNTSQIFKEPDFIVLSFGRDGVGGIPKNKTVSGIPCPDPSTALRERNCDLDLNFIKAPALTNASVDNSAYFDDVLDYYSVRAPACATAPLNWTDSGTGMTCSATFPATPGGATTTYVANTDGTHNGSAQATCYAGTWGVIVGGTCTSSSVVGACNNSGIKYACTSGSPTQTNSNTCNVGYNGGWQNETWVCSGSSSQSCTNPHYNTCFLPEVQITMADGSTKYIRDLEVGDAVKGHTRTNHVLRLPTFQSDQTVYGFNGGEAFVTGGHPFYTKKGWKAIDPALTPKEGHVVKTTKLKIGDRLLTDQGTYITIQSIDPQESGEHDLFSPVMDGDHTYYANGLLVHNKADPTNASFNPPNGPVNPCVTPTSTPGGTPAPV